MKRAAWVAVFLAALTLSACTAAQPEPIDTAAESPSSVSFSEKEAIAAYRAYLDTYFDVLADGGANSDRLNAVAQGRALATAEKNAKEAKDQDLHASGALKLKSARLQSTSGNQVFLYVCEDETALDFIDASGASIADPNRSTLFPYVATLSPNDDEDLVVSELKNWTQGGVC